MAGYSAERGAAGRIRKRTGDARPRGWPERLGEGRENALRRRGGGLQSCSSKGCERADGCRSNAECRLHYLSQAVPGKHCRTSRARRAVSPAGGMSFSFETPVLAARALEEVL